VAPAQMRTLRHRIEHAQIVREKDQRRFAKLNVIASVQPVHCSSDVELARRLWGKHRTGYAYPYKSMADRGAILACGSDAPIERLDPLEGVWSAVTRKSYDGKKKFHSEQALTVQRAVEGFTRNAAYSIQDERLHGVLSVGMSADIVVMDTDVFACEPARIREVEINATFFEGECVYTDETIIGASAR